MRTTLTIEQSSELIKRGVCSDKASKRVTRQVADSRGREIEKLRLKRWKDCVPYEKATMTNLHVGLMRFEHKEIFTLADLLSLLPKEIEKIYSLEICADNVGWDIVYGTYHEGCEPKHIAADKELVNALYTALLWAIDHNHAKLD